MSYKQNAARRKGLTPEKYAALVVLLGEALANEALAEMGEDPAATVKAARYAIRYKQGAPVESLELPIALARAIETARRRLPDDELIAILNTAARQAAAGKAKESRTMTTKAQRLKEALSHVAPRDLEVLIDNLKPAANSLLLDNKVKWKDTYQQAGESRLDYAMKLLGIVPEELAARTAHNALQVTVERLTAAQSRKEARSADDRQWQAVEAETTAAALDLRSSDMTLPLGEKAALKAEAAAWRQRARELAGE